ncbi:hypothetical protein [Streptomyces boninensis]|uniref:hypothetical protein n=1 Tax=Streptomyces boninensis TaxID=2039455 RepID=UPI003B21DBF4
MSSTARAAAKAIVVSWRVVLSGSKRPHAVSSTTWKVAATTSATAPTATVFPLLNSGAAISGADMKNGEPFR